MLPMPAMRRWSSRKTLTLTRVPSAMARRLAPVGGSAIGSRPKMPRLGSDDSASASTRRSSPNRRGSWNLSTEPSAKRSVAWTCDAVKGGAGLRLRPLPAAWHPAWVMDDTSRSAPPPGPPARFEEFARLATEQRNPRTRDLDTLEVPGILERIAAEDRLVPDAVARELPYIAKAAELVVASFREGGRLIYVGAGTSGRLGVLDASECPPTFGSYPEMVQGVMAGGLEALVRAVEGAEDREAEGVEAIEQRKVGPKDTVIGLAASRRTPFVVAALGTARRLEARTAYVTCTPRSEFTLAVDVAIGL